MERIHFQSQFARKLSQLGQDFPFGGYNSPLPQISYFNFRQKRRRISKVTCVKVLPTANTKCDQEVEVDLVLVLALQLVEEGEVAVEVGHRQARVCALEVE
jgi:hypothetical protein